METQPNPQWDEPAAAPASSSGAHSQPRSLAASAASSGRLWRPQHAVEYVPCDALRERLFSALLEADTPLSTAGVDDSPALLADHHLDQHPVPSRGELHRLGRLVAVAAHREQALIAQHARVARQAERQDLQRAVCGGAVLAGWSRETCINTVVE